MSVSIGEQGWMEVLKLKTISDGSGYLNLTVPTHLGAGKVDVVVVLNPGIASEEEALWYDFSDLMGRLSWQGDPVAVQRTLRSEMNGDAPSSVSSENEIDLCRPLMSIPES
jgi:hypothetical protein